MSSMHFAALEHAIHEAIVTFEPRIDPKTLAVEVNREAGFSVQHNSLRLVIRGHMWNQPVPLELLLSADVDVETGLASVRDLRA
jgi:type VI secretion system protein ImpF